MKRSRAVKVDPTPKRTKLDEIHLFCPEYFSSIWVDIWGHLLPSLQISDLYTLACSSQKLNFFVWEQLIPAAQHTIKFSSKTKNNTLERLLSRVKVLKSLDLSNCKTLFPKSIEKSLMYLSKLEELSLPRLNISYPHFNFLSHLRSLKSLSLPQIPTLAADTLPWLTNLETLIFTHQVYNGCEPGIINSITSLKFLSIFLPSWGLDLGPVKKLNLEALHLKTPENTHQTFSDFDEMLKTSLTDLHIHGQYIPFTDPILLLTTLTKLHVWTEGVEDFTPIGVALTNLTDLWVGTPFEYLHGLEAISHLTNLTKLSAQGEPGPFTGAYAAHSLSSLTNLLDLDLAQDFIWNDGILLASRLQTLKFNKFRLSAGDISSISTLPNLEKLTIRKPHAKTTIASMSELGNLRKLKILEFFGGPLPPALPIGDFETHFKNLTGLTSLETLDLGGERLTDDSLALFSHHFRKIRNFSFSGEGNELTDFRALVSLPELKNVKFSGITLKFTMQDWDRFKRGKMLI